MTSYRVGQAGATVFDEDGGVVHRLRPGHIVVEGSIETPGSLADQHKRLKRQADKSMRAGRDFIVPGRAPLEDKAG